jgi:hypothetical protein
MSATRYIVRDYNTANALATPASADLIAASFASDNDTGAVRAVIVGGEWVPSLESDRAAQVVYVEAAP